MVGRVGFEPTRGTTPADFRTTMAFATPVAGGVCSLDFPLTLGAHRRSRPSSLYTFFPHAPVIACPNKATGHKALCARSLARGCHHHNVLRVPRLWPDSRGEFPTPVLVQVRSVCPFATAPQRSIHSKGLIAVAISRLLPGGDDGI
jgi:hypothetical protein